MINQNRCIALFLAIFTCLASFVLPRTPLNVSFIFVLDVGLSGWYYAQYQDDHNNLDLLCSFLFGVSAFLKLIYLAFAMS